MAKRDDSHELALAALAASRVFGDLTVTAQRKLAGVARLEHCRTPTLLQAARERATHLRVVLDGQIEFVARNAAGEEVTLGAIGRGGWATWLAVFDSAPPGHDFYSSHDSRFIAFPADAVKRTARAFPELYPRIIDGIGMRFRNVLEWLEQSTILDGERRLAKLLQLLARTSNQARGVVHMPQERLAKLARCSRQSANAALKSLAARGLIVVRYRRIEIVSDALIDAFVARRRR